jgi:hypothetical protein
MLKAVKHLSMNPPLLDVLQNANALEILIRILEAQSSGPHSAVSDIILPISLFLTSFYIMTILGILEPHFPDMLQFMSSEQIPSRGSGPSGNYTVFEASYRHQFTSQTIRASHPLRFS